MSIKELLMNQAHRLRIAGDEPPTNAELGLRRRENELAQDLFHRWVIEEEIDYSEMMLTLRKHVEEDGIDEERVFIQISRLYNPSRSI